MAAKFDLKMLPEETRCAILSKMSPVSFIRMRKTGSFMDKYAKSRRRHIGILLDSLKISCQTMEFDHEGNEEAVITVCHTGIRDHVVNQSTNRPFTTTTEIFRSLSGFAFKNISFFCPVELKEGDALFSLLGDMKKRCTNLDLILQDPRLVEVVKPKDVTMRLEYFSHHPHTAIPVPSGLPVIPNLDKLYISAENLNPKAGAALIQKINKAQTILLSPRNVPSNEVCQLTGGILSAWQKGECFGRIETLLVQTGDTLCCAEQAVRNWYSLAVKETAYKMRGPEIETHETEGTIRSRAELRTPWRQGGMFTVTATHYKRCQGCEIQLFFYTNREDSISPKEVFPRIYIGGFSM